ncbi:MAG: transketolase C-terminal domain-containing protein, partial [Candidatus Omnitrophica bacterium]|nr:transketolase C-terminal domain-containing protein [Candidatus Omnitrophota bacterium]
MRNAYIAALHDLARDNKKVLALVADNGAIVYDKYLKDYPDRFFNFGISEANMVSVAAGLASCGKIPFAYTISCFITMRAFEQIRNDVCLQKMNVKLVGIGSGFVYSNLGPTHHATEDIAVMRTLPGMTIFSPADPLEAKKATIAAARIDGPVYLRLSTGGTPHIYKEDYEFNVGQGVTLKEGGEIAIISTGGILHDVLKAADELRRKGVFARVINIHSIKPVDKDIILKAAREIGAVLTVEEHSIIGGLGSAVAEVISE